VVYRDFIMFVFGGKGDTGAANPRLHKFDFGKLYSFPITYLKLFKEQQAWASYDCEGPTERWGQAFAYHPYHHSLVVHGGTQYSSFIPY